MNTLDLLDHLVASMMSYVPNGAIHIGLYSLFDNPIKRTTQLIRISVQNIILFYF
jgi:hypothetical protein